MRPPKGDLPSPEPILDSDPGPDAMTLDAELEGARGAESPALPAIQSGLIRGWVLGGLPTPDYPENPPEDSLTPGD